MPKADKPQGVFFRLRNTGSHPKHHPYPAGFAGFIFQVNDLEGDLMVELAVIRLLDSALILLANV
jgi:hypothetical protein